MKSFFVALWQAAAPALPGMTAGDGITAGGFGLIAWLWNQERIRQQTERGDFKTIVQENTKANTELTEVVRRLNDHLNKQN